MKATGLVRRIDNLGRIIIPKEVRKELRIREGNQIEIFTYSEGSIIFKKYSPIRELTDFVNKYGKSLEQIVGNIIIICDKDNIISVNGVTQEKYLQKKVSLDLEKVMENTKSLIFGKGRSKTIPLFVDEVIDGKYTAQIISPIFSGKYVVGAVIIVSTEQNKNFGQLELKSAETAAIFLGNKIDC